MADDSLAVFDFFGYSLAEFHRSMEPGWNLSTSNWTHHEHDTKSHSITIRLKIIVSWKNSLIASTGIIHWTNFWLKMDDYPERIQHEYLNYRDNW